MTNNCLPPGWSSAPLQELVDVLDSQRVPVSSKERARRPGKVPYYGASGPVGTIDKHIFDEPLLLLGEDGVQFFDPAKTKAYLVDGKSWVNNHAHVLRVPGDFIDRRYLKFFLDAFDYHGYANGTTRLKLTKSALNRIPVLVPPLAEQQRLADRLEVALTGIAAVEAPLTAVDTLSIALVAALRRAAATGELSAGSEEQAPDREHVRRLRSNVAGAHRLDVRPGPVPSEVLSTWTVVSLSDACWDIDYGTSTRCAYDGTGAGVLRIPNVVQGRIDITDLKRAVDADLDLGDHLVEAGDVLLVRTNGSRELIGRCAPVEADLDLSFASYLIRLRVLTEVVDPRWVTLVLSSPHWRRMLEERAASTAGQYNLSISKLSDIPLPLPPLGEQQRVLRLLGESSEPVESTRSDASRQRLRLNRLRAALLTAAFSGSLVAQCSADEPAELLLKRLAEARSERVPTAPRLRGRTVPGARGARRTTTEETA